MRIRSQLLILVLAAIAPVGIFAAITTLKLWDEQRVAYEHRFLERVGALRLALDTEIEGTIRTLRSLADSADFDPVAPPDRARAHFERLLAIDPGWITMGVAEPSGRPVVRVDARPLPAEALLDQATADAVRATGRPAISNLVTWDGSRALVTFVAVPVVRKDRLHAIVYLGIEHDRWLDFLKSHPIAERATLTLNDREARIIARTLNDERWAGKTSSADYWNRTIGRIEGTFRNKGLEGQRFYSAFSRLETAGWVLGTGVPRDEVEAKLSVPTVLLLLGILSAALAASAIAWVLGRRVAATVTELSLAAKSMAVPERPRKTEPLPIAEAETVRVALDEAAVLLEARERSLSDALDREAQSRAQAEHANQTKDQFLAMLGHELRNPISAINAAFAVLELEGTDEETLRRARDIVRRQVRHLTEIVNDLLDVARLTAGKVSLNRQSLDLSAVVRHVVAGFREAGRCGHLTLDTDLQPAPIVADETRLEQVVGNLLDNACKYTPPGGHVRITVAAQGNDAELIVRDDGSGIAPDALPHIFDVFAQGQRTIDRAQGGLGLGLTVVRRLVELHGGSVSVASEGRNLGATFTVRLPRGEDAPMRSRADPSVALPARRIVLVEDNADSREVIATLLRTKGHEVTIAGDGPAGVAAIAQGRPDVALVDIGLPGFDGTELARRIRASDTGRSVVLIALTGYGSAGDRARALEAGFDAFLVKPFDMHTFESAVATADAARPAMPPV